MTHETELEYVGFWARLGATLIDTILMIIILYPLLTMLYGWAYWDSEKIVQGPLDLLLSWVLPALVTILFWRNKAGTPGKMAIGARIVDADTGTTPATRQLIVRYVGYYLSAIPLCLGFFWIAFDAKKQGWHDKLANTVVVRHKGGMTAPVRFDKS